MVTGMTDEGTLPTDDEQDPVLRIDVFDVPAEALEAFVDRLRATHRHLDGLEGSRQNRVLRQVVGTGR